MLRCFDDVLETLMKAYRLITLIAAILLTAIEVMILASASSKANAAEPAPCTMRLSVELTPDVPNSGDPEFLSSLLSNHPAYRLTLQQQDEEGSLVVLSLVGPGPGYRCANVVETMRRDARVLSVRVDSDDMEAVSVVAASVPPEEKSNLHLSRAGIGSLSWAAKNPAQAWRLVYPVQPGDADGAYQDFRAQCAATLLADTPSGKPTCP